MDFLDENEMYNIIQVLNDWTKAYDEGKPKVSDKEWDELYFKLKEMEKETGIVLPNSPTNSISYEVISELQKVKHNHKMLSLDKTKDWDEFIGYFAKLNPFKDVCGMLKMDGLTCSLKYVDGKLVSAETRGDGIIGENILHNARTLRSIPQTIDYKDEFIIDGEVICTYKDFKPFEDEYKNPRNFASGSIRLLDANECKKRNLTFVAWNVIKGFDEENSFMKKLESARNLGFTIVPFTPSFDWDAREYLIELAKTLGYPIDGLVGRFDDVAYGQSLGETIHHVRAAYAFKFYDEEYETTLEDIEWSMGRTGVYTPVAIFESVNADGSVISRASLHNLSVLKEVLKTPFRGQKIKVAKMNMIIPQVTWAEHPEHIEAKYRIRMPLRCSCCDEPLTVKESDSGVENVYCPNPNCEGKLSTRLDHFAGKKGLDIKGISKATIEKLIDWGWISSIGDIFELKQYREEWIKKPGFGVKSVDNILNAIEKSKEVSLDKFIAALGIPLIGNSVAKELTKYIKSYSDFRDKVNNRFDFAQFEGFADSKTLAIWKFDYSEADRIYNNYISIPEVEEVEESAAQTLDGVTVVITGKLTMFKNRAALQSAIESAGGKVVGSISKNVKYLINNDVNSTSSKNLAAKKLEIPIISEQNFVQKFLT